VLLCRRHHRRVHEDGWKICSDKVGQVVFFTPTGKALGAVPRAGEVPRPGEVPRAVEVPILREVASVASVAFRAAVSPADAGGLSTAGPTWRHDRDVPWSIEAAAWEALDPSGAS
jgi:hypothetical protein